MYEICAYYMAQLLLEENNYRYMPFFQKIKYKCCQLNIRMHSVFKVHCVYTNTHTYVHIYRPTHMHTRTHTHTHIETDYDVCLICVCY